MHILCTTEFYFLLRTETDPGASKSIASSEWQRKEKSIENESTRKNMTSDANFVHHTTATKGMNIFRKKNT